MRSLREGSLVFVSDAMDDPKYSDCHARESGHPVITGESLRQRYAMIATAVITGCPLSRGRQSRLAE
jgi:hypothetical protein